jgi:sugar/nucleoside kinase (ribokinase family)
VDIFLPSIEETFFTLHPREYLQRKAAHGGRELSDYVSPEEIRGFAEEILSMGCKVAGLKAGHNGWYIKTTGKAAIAGMGRAAPRDPDSWAGRELWCPAFNTERIVGTTGAGDSSIAAFLTGLLRGHGLTECLKFANAAGYLNLRAPDTISGLVPWEELQRIYPTLAVREINSLSDGWHWDKRMKIWERTEAS